MKNKTPATKIGASVLITLGVIILSSLLLPKTPSIGAAPGATQMTQRKIAAAKAKAADQTGAPGARCIASVVRDESRPVRSAG